MLWTRRELFWSAGLAGSFGMLSRLAEGQTNPAIMYDDDGLIVHKGMNGGDTAQREGWYWLGVKIRQEMGDPWPIDRKLKSLSEVIQRLEPRHDGVFYRHPKLKPWNNPYDKEYGFSRDQMVPLVAAMGVWGMTAELRRLWNALPQDVVGGTKHTFNGEWKTILGQKTVFTGDIVGPMTINLFRRAWNEDPWPAGDHNGPGGEQELLFNVKNLRLPLAEKDPDNTGDDLNLIVMLLMSILRFKSAVSEEAVDRYKGNAAKGYSGRAESFGSYMKAYRAQYGGDVPGGDSEEAIKKRKMLLVQGLASGWKRDENVTPVYGAVRWYHRLEAGANPQLAELYAPIIHKYLA